MSFARTIRSHGCASLPPADFDPADVRQYRVTLRIGGRALPVTLHGHDGYVDIDAPRMRASDRAELHRTLRRMFRLDDDLSQFYAMIADDPLLDWAAREGAGRLLASPTVFEDVIKTICTTNCAWSATIRMTTALVRLGEGAFPDGATLARTPESWFSDVARMGYRGPYVKSIAAQAASGAFDFEALRAASGADAETVEAALLALPGVGPYAAAHIMQLVGFHGRLVLDSWTRPTYLRRSGRGRATDTTIRRAFARYKQYAGLAFWLFLTREWVAA